MGLLLGILWIGSVIAGWILGSERQGNGAGCLWAVVLFLLGPLAFIVVLLYYFLGRDEDDRR